MKKIFAILLTATMLCALFVLPSAAADDINFAASVPFIENAPTIDGVVNLGEYNSVEAQHSYSANPEQFSQQDDHDEYDNWDVEFYSAWDADNLYFAWVVKSEVHKGLEKGTYDGYTKVSDEWPETNPYGPMWFHSCIQFMLTPGAPGGSTSFAENYLEVGLCLLSDNEIGRVAWTLPKGVDEDEISLNDWDAAIVRDDVNGTTTYEVAIPKMMTGLYAFGTDAQFGFTYAAAAQENYGTKKGMLEWQDCNLGSKNPDNAAVMTLEGGSVEQENPNEVVEGEVPEAAKGEGVVQIAIDKINTAIAGEDSVIITDTTLAWNGSWACNMLLKPIEGEENAYEVVESIQPMGAEPAFTTEITDDMIVLAVHSMNEEGSTGKDRYTAAASIGAGSKVVLFGVDAENGDITYTNSMIYTTEIVAPVVDEPDTSTDVSDDSSADVSADVSDDSSADVSDDNSKDESKDTSKDTSSKADESKDDEGNKDEGKFPIVPVIIAIVAVIAVVVVVVIVVAKKKK